MFNDTGHRVTLAIDRGLLAFEEIHGHPLVNTMTTAISRADLLRFLEATGHPPLIVDVAVGDDEAA